MTKKAENLTAQDGVGGEAVQNNPQTMPTGMRAENAQISSLRNPSVQLHSTITFQSKQKKLKMPRKDAHLALANLCRNAVSVPRNNRQQYLSKHSRCSALTGSWCPVTGGGGAPGTFTHL